MFTEGNLREALGSCYVPALRRDVVAAGLVRSAAVELDRTAPGAGIVGVPTRYVARVVLVAPGSDDAINAHLQAAVENILLGLPTISRAEVTVLPALFPILQGR